MRETNPDRLRERRAPETDTAQRGEELLAVAETGPNRLLRRRHARRGPFRVGAPQAGVGITDPAFRLRQLLHQCGSRLIEGRPSSEVVD